jgi:hypothetical protein
VGKIKSQRQTAINKQENSYMNKYKLLVAVAVAGFLGMSARASISGYDLVNIKSVVLMQTNETTSGSTTKYNVTKVKVTNKDVLKLIEMEFGTNFPSAGTNGLLAIDYFFDGSFYVLDKNGNEILYASGNDFVEDDYELYLDYDNYVYTGSDSPSKETYNYVTTGEFYYEDATDANYFEVYGPTFVKETYSNTDSESFLMSALVGDGRFNENSAVVLGTVKGAGKNVDD